MSNSKKHSSSSSTQSSSASPAKTTLPQTSSGPTSQTTRPEPPTTPPRGTTLTTESPKTQEPRTHPDAIYDFFVYATTEGTFEEKNINGKLVNLFTICFRNYRGELEQLQIWGAHAQTYFNFFGKCIKDLNVRLFQLPNTDDISSNDATTLYLKPTDPKSNFESAFKRIYKLGTKSSGFLERKLTAKAFPKMVTWKEDTFYLSDGTPLPHPETWAQEVAPLNFENLFEIAEMEVPPTKKIKNEKE
jgi:hypothetical protein